MFKLIRCMLILLVLTVASDAKAAESGKPGQNGRFQIVFSPHMRADTFLVDTQTGRVWQMTTFTDVDGQPTVWESMDRIDDMTQLMRYIRLHAPKAPKQTPPDDLVSPNSNESGVPKAQNPRGPDQ